MNILGINGAIGWDSNVGAEVPDGYAPLSPDLWVHGAAACLISDGCLIGAIEEERFSRRKHDGNYPTNSIQALLSKSNLVKTDINIVVYVGNSVPISTDLRRSGYITRKLQSYFPNAEIQIVDHHNAHIANAFLTSPFDEANVFTFDGAGDHHYFENWLNNSTFSIATKTPFNILKTLTGYDNFNVFAVGSFYDYMSYYCLLLKKGLLTSNGKVSPVFYQRDSMPGKVMGMGAYGNVTNVDTLLQNPFILSHLSQHDMPVIHFIHNKAQRNLDIIAGGGVLAEDIALWAQKVFENVVCEFLSRIPSPYKKRNLCLGGGCALNILTNSKILTDGIYEDVHINTAPNDAGLCLGAALLGAYERDIAVELPENMGCLGLEYDNQVVEQTLYTFDNIQFSKWPEESLSVFVASKLKENCIIAWHKGQSEFGPRALGNRSIFANPSYYNKDRLNKAVKFREEWRPYAAIIMEEHLSEWIDIPKKDSRYMLFSGVVKDSKRALIPSVTHADNTCRVQTVTPTFNGEAYQLLNEFYKLTGIPLLLNTSFNTIPGEPIVETPQDAIKSFLHSQIDYLIINNFVITRK